MRAIVYEDELGQSFTVGEIPAELEAAAQEAHHALIDAIAEHDDELMEAYLEDESSVTPEMIRRALRAGTLADAITPVLLGSAFKNKGVQPLLDAVVDYLPSPLDVPAVQGTDPKTDDEITRAASEDAPFSALVFKVMSDPFVGKLTYFRVYSGRIKAGDRVLNTTNGRTERIGRILQMHANHREEREEIGAGEIAAAVGLKQSTTGDTLAVESAPIVLESMTFPDPVISVAIEPKTKGDQDKLGQGLQRLAEEDPTFRVSTDEETGQTLIAGMGELHLEILVDRLLREFKVDANVGRPQVAYRETAGAGRRQGPGAGSSARRAARASTATSTINLIPQEPGEGYEFEDKIVGGKIPKEYIKPVDEGIQEALGAGVLAGYPVVDVKVELVDGSYHDVDSSERAFKIAGSMAFKEAMKRVEAEAARADDGRRGRHARGLPRRRDGQPQLAARPGRAPRAARQLAVHQGERAAVRDVRLRHRPAVDDPGAGHVHHAVRPLRGRSAVHRGGHRRRPDGASRQLGPEGDRNRNGQAEVRAQRSRTSTSARSVTSTTARRP